MSGLADTLREEIRRVGPIPLARYMDAALNDPAHGYYRTRDPLGAAGDFVTAPEISQMFGELVGAWLAVAWQNAGGPEDAHLVELGPGRGTLMADALRATSQLANFHTAVQLHLVETNPVLRAAQARALAPYQAQTGAPVWHDKLSELPPGPLFLIANEFFDALPIEQYIYTNGAWFERRVGLTESDEFAFVVGPQAYRMSAMSAPGREGEIRETRPGADLIVKQLAERLAMFGGAALIVDYGTAGGETGDTLQAMRGHARHDPLIEPGSADITSLVDFAALAETARKAGARAFGPVEQGPFLETLGIGHRAQVLVRSDPDRAGKIALAVKRLIAPTEMGTLFKVLALTGGKTGDPPPGFPETS
ncbi:MAG: class I SAM-dependent methyltransferase [Alphaproteobacteria bacterium]